MAVVEIDGTSDGLSEPSGSLGVSWALSGTADGTSTANGNLNVSRKLSGTADGASTASGILSFIYEFTLVQGYRIAETALAQYELYVGEDAPPDLDAAPAATSATLPFSHAITPPVAGLKTIYSVLRQRTVYGLVSLNQQPKIFVIDDNGDLVLGPLTAPTLVTSYPTVTGYADVLASYNYSADEDSADKWEIYAKLNSDPVIGVDSPILTVNVNEVSDGIAYLNENIGPFATGNTLHVLVAVKRDADNERNSAAVVEVILPAAPELNAELASVFGGIVHEAR
jgi:hypothetical protein